MKVQFPAVARQLKMDLATISLCVRIVGRMFPKFQFTWVLPEFKEYMNQEIDFSIEAKNNAKIKQVRQERLVVFSGLVVDLFFLVSDVC